MRFHHHCLSIGHSFSFMTINYKRQMLDDMAYGIILFYYILYAILIYILFYFGKAFYTSESYIGIIGIFYLRCHGYFIACTYFHSLVFMLLFFMKFIVNRDFLVPILKIVMVLGQ